MQKPSPSKPQHVAIIMDGNGRWALSQKKSRSWGHVQGAQALWRCLDYALQDEIPHLTVFAFSCENWKRPSSEVEALFALLGQEFEKICAMLETHKIRVSFLGRRDRIPQTLVEQMTQLEALSSCHTALHLRIALDYSGRWEIDEAVRRAYLAGQQGLECVHDFAQATPCASLGDVDLLIRTGYEQRLSNFLLAHLAYAELHFTACHWPEFEHKHWQEALEAFKNRERRYGQHH